MSNRSRRPWYRRLEFLIPIIAVILGAILTPLMMKACTPPPADFNISVDPMEGKVQQGGVISTAITVKGINGYEYSVSISASNQPSGVIVTFVPPFGGPTPSYTSTVTINVNPDVSPDSYDITINGLGADGKEQSCKYILNVMPSTEEATALTEATTTLTEETITSTEIKIISPKKGEEVPVSTIASGTFSGELPEGQYMWVVVNPHASPGQWWPQARIDPQEEWDITIWLGGEEETGIEFDIAVILVNEEDNQDYVDYLKTGEETGSYPGIPLPASADVRDRITVVRK